MQIQENITCFVKLSSKTSMIRIGFATWHCTGLSSREEKNNIFIKKQGGFSIKEDT